jgi:hypothetical protein
MKHLYAVAHVDSLLDEDAVYDSCLLARSRAKEWCRNTGEECLLFRIYDWGKTVVERYKDQKSVEMWTYG